MHVYIEKDDEIRELEFAGTIKDLLEELGVNPQTVIITQDDELMTLDDKVDNTAEIKLLSVISGG